VLRHTEADAGNQQAAAVEMLKVLIVPPPVPHVSTNSSGRSAGRTIIAWRSERTTAASSSDVSPFTRSPTMSAAIWTGVASPGEDYVERRGQLGGIRRFSGGEPFDRAKKRVSRHALMRSRGATGH
jgi:hypothetical protein